MVLLAEVILIPDPIHLSLYAPQTKHSQYVAK